MGEGGRFNINKIQYIYVGSVLFTIEGYCSSPLLLSMLGFMNVQNRTIPPIQIVW